VLAAQWRPRCGNSVVTSNAPGDGVALALRAMAGIVGGGRVYACVRA
jgi:hypothetical protein